MRIVQPFLELFVIAKPPFPHHLICENLWDFRDGSEVCLRVEILGPGFIRLYQRGDVLGFVDVEMVQWVGPVLVEGRKDPTLVV